MPTAEGHCEKYRQSAKDGTFALARSRSLITGSYSDHPSQINPGSSRWLSEELRAETLQFLPPAYSPSVEPNFHKQVMMKRCRGSG